MPTEQAATYKGQAWLARHPRWTFHFTPTSGSWLNAVENFFSVLTRKRIRRGSFHSIVDLQAAIKRYLAQHNVEPKPITTRSEHTCRWPRMHQFLAPFDYIERFYNPKRRHSTLGYLSPVEFEKQAVLA